MKIKTIHIKNFKSIKDITIHCNKGMNAFIGKNGTGKSAVFEAINFVLGEMYPTANSFKSDWFNDANEDLVIKIDFFEPYYKFYNKNGHQQTISQIIFEASYNGSKVETKLIKSEGDSWNINGEEARDPHRINYIGSNRTVKSIMPTNSWSLLGRQFYSSNFFTDEIQEEFRASMDNAKASLEKSDKFKDFIESIQDKLSKQINRQDLKSEFKMYDTNHFLKTLEFYIEKNGKKINLTDEGSGIQNSFILGVIQTLSETDFRKNNKKSNNPIFIDEPELYLHPHAKKSLYNTLKNLSESATDELFGEIIDGTQIFYITHSSEFLSYEDSDRIHKFYIDEENGTQCKTGDTSLNIGKTNEKIIENDEINKNKISFNNAFFADIVLFVEGYSDYLFMEYIIFNKTQKTLEELNISILETGKSKMAKFYQMYSEFVDCFALFDKDNKNDEDNDNKELLNLPNSYGFTTNLEGFLEYSIDKSGEKVKKIREWIKTAVTNDKQLKIDGMWNKIENLFNDYAL